MDANGYFKYWGKAPREEDGGAPCHLLPYHCLDVAAVGRVLLLHHDRMREHLHQLSGVESAEMIHWIVLFLVLHDLGKFSEGFQNLRPDLLATLQNRKSDKPYVVRHDSLGFVLWRGAVKEWLLGGQRRRGNLPVSGFDYWASAVMGHHGQPPRLVENDDDYFLPQDHEAALAFVESVAAFLVPNREIPGLDIQVSKRFSWWLAGFAVLCDWLGSDSQRFKYCSDEIPLADYWEIALDNARDAVKAAQLIPAQAASLQPLQHLFGFTTPTPLQGLCSELPLNPGPQLFILEDVTGAGKTEAAVILLHRMLAQGSAEGVYFALPTMATANAMYERMAAVYQRLYAPESHPSLVLAHGARDLSAQFRQSIIPEQPVSLTTYGDETETASAHCSAWLADNRKKALLAEVGVGTIDQSLLALLPSKHQSLRMLGLLGKVLIVDEVHACDAYVNELLCAVLKAHAASGGSAILLSATLPATQRQRLLDAYAQGCDGEQVRIGMPDKESYPLLTHYSAHYFKERIVATRASVRRSVKVNRVVDVAAVLDEIGAQIAAGRCVCWVRNTVDDAREAFALVKGRLPDAAVDLFHARYAMADRLAIEERILHHFGCNSAPELRSGRVLVATQVVEQSLDLDFDLMVTDLAPIDLIIQRAGRLCRHARDREGARIEGADQRGVPTLIVHGPDPNGEINADWYKAHFKRAAGVYPNHARLWLTAKLLADKGGFEMPGDARELIEGVYGNVPYPESLQDRANDAEGEASAMRSVAMLNVLKLDAGYGSDQENCWWDETITPTRLGEESITVYLARWEGDALTPWASDVNQPWPNSAVQVRKALIAGEANEGIPVEKLESCKKQLPAQGKWGVLLALTMDGLGMWCGCAIDRNGLKRRVEYDKEQGVRVSEKTEG